jgi:hypothetical protein
MSWCIIGICLETLCECGVAIPEWQLYMHLYEEVGPGHGPIVELPQICMRSDFRTPGDPDVIAPAMWSISGLIGGI